MKILQVSHGFPPKENAGVELYTYYLSRALVQLGHQVPLLCRGEDPGREDFSAYEEVVDGLNVTRVVNRLTWLDGYRALYDNHFMDSLFSKTLDQERPEVIHFQHLFGLSAYLIRLAKARGYPVVFTLHDFFVLCPRVQLLKKNDQLCQGPRYGLECVSCLETLLPGDARTKLFLRYKDILPFPVIKWTKRFFLPPKYLDQMEYEVFHRYRYMYEVLKACDLLLTPSRFVRDFFIKYYHSMAPKIRAIPLGIPPFNAQARSRKAEEKVRFCYFGNVLPHKGLHVLLDAFKGLPGGKARLTIYGGRTPWNQDYYDRLKQEASGFEVSFPGSYNREDLPEAFSDQDIAVFPPIWPETFSIVIREAHLLGLPVIASRIGAIPVAVREGVDGLLFRPGDREDLRRCMLRFLDAPGLIKEMASKLPRPKSMLEHASEMTTIYDEIRGRER